MPVNWDIYTTLGLQLVNVPNPWLSGLAGTLDPSGQATLAITLDPGAAAVVAGERFTFSSVLIDPATGALSPSAPVSVTVVP